MPDDRCIADFRKDNSGAIKKVFREFSLMCSRLGLYGGKDVSVDGTKLSKLFCCMLPVIRIFAVALI